MVYALHVLVELEDAEWLEAQVKALRFLSRAAAVRWCVDEVKRRGLLARWDEVQQATAAEAPG